MKRAIEITQVDFSIVCGRRTQAEQRALFHAGKTPSLNSRHLTGHAVDVAPFVGGKIVWDWPSFRKLAPFIEAAAVEVGCPIQWGGNWKAPNTPDGPHWQIPWGK
jgi:peptidoglycan L-alanyl-D-glutamate endopeptidase CwlK